MSEESTAGAHLLEAAARVIALEGAGALSTRRLAKEAGTSTMAVYTHFGSMPELVKAVVAEGFARLAARMAADQATDDPVADLGRMAIAFRANALANPHLHEVMFGRATPGDGRLPDPELAAGRLTGGAGTFMLMVEATSRAMAAGRFRPGDPAIVAAQLWSAIHGYVMLELAGHFNGDTDARAILAPLLTNLAIGLGDDPETVRTLAAALTGA